ncbi:MAG: metalloregulator ArsR/SmtB family transcription factor [Clostridia bacterium]|nr:metalloregulator ArsR/SmtB family transcription factor [Clostridia bacterium]
MRSDKTNKKGKPAGIKPPFDVISVPFSGDSQLNEQVVAEVRSEMPDINLLYDLAELYRIFADSTRIRILYVLFEREVCVCDIAAVLDMTVSAVSHQLRLLRGAHLVRFRRVGKVCFYSLADDHVKTIIGQGMDHLTEG